MVAICARSSNTLVSFSTEWQHIHYFGIYLIVFMYVSSINCVYYMRNGTFYLEYSEELEVKHIVKSYDESGRFLGPQTGGYFNAIDPDMQSSYHLICHEVILLSNHFVDMNDLSMNHCESTRVHRRLLVLKLNVADLPSCLNRKGHPCIIAHQYYDAAPHDLMTSLANIS